MIEIPIPKIAVTIPLQDAQDRIRRWQDRKLQINAFTFGLVEFMDLAFQVDEYNKKYKDKPVDAFRFYLGVTDELSGNRPCLLFVGVNGFSPDTSGGDDLISLNLKDKTDTTIFDFSYPCPDTCANTGHSIMDVPYS